jgi:uncharacterized membrane protein YvlD (DUF360 family)
METNVTPIIAEIVTRVKYVVVTNTNFVTNTIDQVTLTMTNWVNPEKLAINQVPETIIGSVVVLVFGWIIVTLIKNQKEGQ